MTLMHSILSKNPAYYWPLTTNFTDLAGGPTTTVSAAPAYNQRYINTDGASALFDTTDRATTTNTAFLAASRETQDFSVETWVRASGTPAATRLIWGRDTANGLTITSTGFTFAAAITGGTSISLSYVVPTWVGTNHIVVTYAGRAFTLYVNGESVATASFTGTFTTATTAFLIGGTSTTSTASVYLNDVAIYYRSLTAEEIARHYSLGTTLSLQSDLAEADGAITYDFTDASADVWTTYVDSASEPLPSLDTNLVLSGGSLKLVDTATAGTRVIAPSAIGDAGVIDGSRITWDATSTVTVERTLDGGATWAACTNNATIPGLAEGANVDGITLGFRVTVPANTVGHWYKSLRAVIYLNKSMRGSLTGMMATGIEPYTLADIERIPLSAHQRTGVQIRTPGAVILPAAPTGSSWKALELWVRTPSTWGASQYLVDFRLSEAGTIAYIWTSAASTIGSAGFSKVYINGVTKTPVYSDFPVGLWTHVVLVLTGTATNPIHLGQRHNGSERMNVDIGMAALYLSEPGASTVLEHYSNGYNRLSGKVTDTLTLTEGVYNAGTGKFGPRAYKYAWNVELGR